MNDIVTVYDIKRAAVYSLCEGSPRSQGISRNSSSCMHVWVGRRVLRAHVFLMCNGWLIMFRNDVEIAPEKCDFQSKIRHLYCNLQHYMYI